MLNRHAYEWLGIAAIAAPVLLAAGCDRSRTVSDDEKDKIIASFKIPNPDLSKLSDGLREMMRGTRRLVVEDPGATEDVFSLGARYYVHGFPAEAKQCFTYLTRLEPDKVAWWYYLGLDEELMANKAGAIAAFEKALKLDGSYEPLYLRLADLQAADHPEIAAKRFAEALERNPYSASAQYGLGL